MTGWKPALALDAQRHVTSGSTEALCAAVRGDTDPQIGTAFIHGELIDLMSADERLIVQVADPPTTYHLAMLSVEFSTV